jgi:hypothetical protein
MVSRIIDKNLSWIRNSQQRILLGSKLKKHNNNEIEEAEGGIDLDEEDGNSNFLPSSFHGSRRHLTQLARNAIAIVSEKDVPTAFITLTCNIKWSEIDRQLLYGQSAFDRPDIVCMVN